MDVPFGFWTIFHHSANLVLALRTSRYTCLHRAQPSVFWLALLEDEDSTGAPGNNYRAGLDDVSAHTVTISTEGHIERDFWDSGTNPPRGAIITYWLRETAGTPIRLNFYDTKGTLINEFYGCPEGTKVEKLDDKHDLRRTTANAGWNRFIWDMRVKPLPKIVGSDPIALPSFMAPK